MNIHCVSGLRVPEDDFELLILCLYLPGAEITGIIHHAKHSYWIYFIYYKIEYLIEGLGDKVQTVSRKVN